MRFARAGADHRPGLRPVGGVFVGDSPCARALRSTVRSRWEEALTSMITTFVEDEGARHRYDSSHPWQSPVRLVRAPSALNHLATRRPSTLASSSWLPWPIRVQLCCKSSSSGLRARSQVTCTLQDQRGRPRRQRSRRCSSRSGSHHRVIGPLPSFDVATRPSRRARRPLATC